jgi:hypothetical protein
MSRRYACTGASVLAASPGKTALNVFQTSNTVRGRLYDVIFGSSGTPADSAFTWRLSKSTAVGTEGTGVVPIALDSGDPAALYDGAQAHSAEPTYTAATELLEIPLNQRATFRWVAAPDGEFIGPATASNGWGLAAFHASSVVASEATFHWQE